MEQSNPTIELSRPAAAMALKRTLTTRDGIQLRYAYCTSDPANPWIALVMPFALDVQLAQPFFDFFHTHYNVCVWESRSILEDSPRECPVAEFSIDRHAEDLFAVLEALCVEEAILVGYCSGAGIALAAINLAPNLFSTLVLAHGEYTMLSQPACSTPFAKDMDTLLSLAASSAERARLVYEKIRNERIGLDVERPDGLDVPFSELRFLRRYASNYLAYKSNDYEQLAADVSHPTLLLAGGRDIQVNVASSQKILGRLRNASLFVDPDADHYGLLRRDSNALIAIWNYLCENAYARQ
jgi:pimeloyl-ACP methyl ester carboxylesterase